MKRFLWVIWGIMAVLIASTVQANENWTLVKDKEGIQSYCRKLPGSNLLEIKAVMVVDAPIENVGELIRDVPGYVDWMPYCGEGLILAGHRDDANVRVLLDLPWPVTDREIILNAKVSYDLDRGRAFIDLTNKADQYDTFDEKVIRIPQFNGRYTIEYITREKTGIIYQYSVDFAGALPKSVTNTVSKQFLYENLTNLRKLASSARYMEKGNQSNDKVLCQAILEDQTRLDSVVMARLAEFINDAPFVEWLSREVSLYDLITSEEGKLSEMLLYSGGQENARLEAVRFVVQKVLESKDTDPELIKSLLGDDQFIRAIRSGEGDLEPRQVLATRLDEAA